MPVEMQSFNVLMNAISNGISTQINTILKKKDAKELVSSYLNKVVLFFANYHLHLRFRLTGSIFKIRFSKTMVYCMWQEQYHTRICIFLCIAMWH